MLVDFLSSWKQRIGFSPRKPPYSVTWYYRKEEPGFPWRKILQFCTDKLINNMSVIIEWFTSFLDDAVNMVN